MKADFILRLRDIRESLSLIEEYASPLTEADFLASRVLQDAIVRRLEIVGEAAKHVPQAIRDGYPAVPWRDMAGMRDVLIHRYAQVDLGMVWDTVRAFVPAVRAEVERMLEKLEGP